MWTLHKILPESEAVVIELRLVRSHRSGLGEIDVLFELWSIDTNRMIGSSSALFLAW
jgi:hypothetical protein